MASNHISTLVCGIQSHQYTSTWHEITSVHWFIASNHPCTQSMASNYICTLVHGIQSHLYTSPWHPITSVH
ncbi:hypothetical protein XELAEV_18019211mg [Xenopus laevis]|uniref:Uncharacterized protein n=1 Tax=Xenopus laevis TaxID=8355 RepID=A0A974DFN8_XENLA|nr:hypothetical protein XELAEV_18019211mg [Xenopus laevis]